MPRVKIHANIKSLCNSCDNGQTVERANGHITILCHWMHPATHMPLDVERCSQYERRGTPSLHHQKEIAWTLELDKGRVVGFRPPEKDKD